MATRPEEAALTPESITTQIELLEATGHRLWTGRTPIGKEVHVFHPRNADWPAPEVGEVVLAEFHPFEMSRARLIHPDRALESSD